MRHLLLAIKEGLIEHRRAILKLIGGVLGIAVALQVVFFFASSSAKMCGSCHIMEPYVKAWQASSHQDVACVTCHREWRYVISATYVKYLSGTYTTQLRAEVPDARCLSCHEKQNLDPDKPFLKNIHFSHKNHLGEMRRGKRLHCTSCHSGLGMGGTNESHVAVQKGVCFTCHFKGAEKGQAATGCLVCHGPPTKVVTHQGFQFDHGTYLKRGVRCDLCHIEVTRGDANVPPERCASCHVSRIEAYENTERVHSIHLQRHEIDCKRCHNVLEHGKVAMAAALRGRCEGCHEPRHTPQEQMYIGIGGKGVADTPSTMFLARVACDSCHVGAGTGKTAESAKLRQSCVTCHGKGYDRMVDDWIREIGGLTRDVTALLASAEAHVRNAGKGAKEMQDALARSLVTGGPRAISAPPPGATAPPSPPRSPGVNPGSLDALLARARHNLEFVKSSRGEHNIRYAVELLRSARKDAADVLARTGAPAPPPQPLLASAAGYCRVCHSTSHLGTRLPYSGLEYDHNRHIAAGLTCDTCHSVEDHGKTAIHIEQCMACHHGPKQARKCEGCHTAQGSLYKGELAGTAVKGDADIMQQAGAGCTDCHDLKATEPVVKVVQKACVTCHKAGYDQQLVDWINEDQKRVQDLAMALAKAQAQTQGESGALAQSHRAAITNADAIYQALLKAKGVHNVMLSQDAYDKAKKQLAWAGAK